jgi:UDP-N-acetylmuramoyl-tripeptide--D-alanyl-D-alanine ligase
MARVGPFRGRQVTIGRAAGADVRASEVTFRGVEGTTAHVVTPAGESDVEVPLPGEGNLANVLAAAAVAVTWGVPLGDVVERAARLTPAPRRGEVVRLGRGVTLVDDSYNSSPSALRGALESLSRDRRHGRRVAWLGEMLELGDHAPALHETCGRAAADAGLAVLVTVGGPAAERMADAAREAGMAADAVRYVSDSATAAALVGELVQPADLVLVKGSRGVRMDVVADRVREVWG